MGAPAVKPARAPQRKPRPKRQTRPRTPRAGAVPARRHAAPVRLVPSAAGRAAEAVGGIAESGLIVRLTRGPAWIGLIAILLVGIVALNVGTLSLNSAASRTGSQADELRLSNSTLRGDLAAASSSTLVAEESEKLGYALPAAGDVRYVDAGPDDAAKAAERLQSGELAGGIATVPDGESPPEEAGSAETVDPLTAAATDPATGAAIDPATGLPVETTTP